MAEIVSSAGLIYLYVNGYEENGVLYIQQIDTYQYMGEGLYEEAMKAAEIVDLDEDIVHIFLVVGEKEKAAAVLKYVEDELRLNFQRMLSEKEVVEQCDMLDYTGNYFFKAVQEFFCEQLGHLPKRIYREYDNFVIGGVYCNHLCDEREDSIVEGMVSFWVERERPMLCGKQIMTKSFFMRDFAGRKVLAVLPENNDGFWRLLFEGGHQLLISDDVTYTKETLHPNDLSYFCASNLQSIFLNPIYAYGKWFQPTYLYEEWNKVFLYLCAASGHVWNRNNICRIYEKFLSFLEKNICVTIDAEPYISKEEFCDCLLIQIRNFRKFLKGEDEPVISKDLLQTMNSRYIYLPYIWQWAGFENLESVFSSSDLEKMIEKAMHEEDIYTKGVLWEDVASYVITNIKGWKITGRRIKTGAQEIDLSVANCSLDNDLWQLGAYVLVECKNWSYALNIRTLDSEGICSRNIECQHDFTPFVSIVIDEYGVYQSVNDSTLILYIPNIAAIE